MQLLLLQGGDQNPLDNDNYTPLYLAVWCGSVAAALALMTVPMRGVTLRHGQLESVWQYTWWLNGGIYIDIIGAAIERGAVLDVTDRHQATPFHHAARYKMWRRSMCSWGLEPTSIEARECDGCTPLQGAACQLHPAVVVAPSKHGAHVSVQDDHRQKPLHWTATFVGMHLGAAEVVDSLLRAGADENILNEGGHIAAAVVEEVESNGNHLPQDVVRVRELLANAPADRAWRCRGYLVLCLAHPYRLRQRENTSNADAGAERRTDSRCRRVHPYFMAAARTSPEENNEKGGKH